MKTSNLLILCTFVCAGATQATAQDESLYPMNTTIRAGYAKRDRVLLGGLEYVSPSQLHENEGLRAQLEFEQQNTDQKRQGQKSDLTNPQIGAAAAYGWNTFTLGVEGAWFNSENSLDNSSFKEKFDGYRVMPEVAYIFGKYFSIGVGVEFDSLDVKEEFTSTQTFNYDFNRTIVGLAYHEPSYEFGIAYTTEVQETESLSTPRETTLTLASTDSATSRSIYLPSMGTVYARGNLSDSFSMMGTVSMARYDGNVEGAIPLFNEYDAQDRLAAKLLGTYWTASRSRISLAAEYKGAATSAINTEENGLGYRLVNLYGGTLEGVLSINRKTYIGANASYMRGERNDTLDSTGERYTGKEDTQKYAGFVTVKL